MSPLSLRNATPSAQYDPACRLCDRLAAFLDEVKKAHPDYFCAPVAPFGDPAARLLVVGLAPGMHGANASGRPFTGDYAGILLYATLHRFGFATAPVSVSVGDGLELIGARITNAVKCLPPGNKPLPAEARQCKRYLSAELANLPAHAAVLALGRIAHDAVLRGFDIRLAEYPFGHGAAHILPNGARLFDSYHCSRYNTNTGRLTTDMFEQVFASIARYLRVGSIDGSGPPPRASLVARDDARADADGAALPSACAPRSSRS